VSALLDIRLFDTIVCRIKHTMLLLLLLMMMMVMTSCIAIVINFVSRVFL